MWLGHSIIDVRKTEPYTFIPSSISRSRSYPQCDCMARYRVRMDEMSRASGNPRTGAIRRQRSQNQIFRSTSSIHRYLGIGFALMILPVNLGTPACHAAERRALGARRSRACSISRCATPSTRPRAKSCFCRCRGLKLKAKPFVDVT